ncbi:hypothetical protein [Alteromonas facilis]|uniref:hypothetical protein n=1 Tax=Alteromonas facilis TaxID=2048004 RepID=UPI000C28A294|nr:hypothetical protein [Alteromonas facilis]
MRYRAWVLLVLFTAFAQAETSVPEHVRVTVNAPGSFPYLYLDPQSNTYTGIVVDILKHLEQSEGIKVEYLDANQLRSEKMLREGLADLYLVNPSWLLQPESVIVSEPLITPTYMQQNRSSRAFH